MSRRNPTVSFVVSTYARPQVLSRTLRSIILQDRDDWEVIIIGDHCGPETAEVVGSLNDDRLRYYNLPSRFGEQSGPNNAGTSVARGRYLAWFNHDDLILSDHLSMALAALQGTESNVYIGRHVRAVVRGDSEATPTPGFERISPLAISNSEALHRMRVLEPISFWLIPIALAQRVGPWKPAVGLRRTPLQDWYFRALRKGARVRLGSEVSGIYVGSHWSNADSYQIGADLHEAVLRSMVSQTPTDLRAVIQHQVESSTSRPKFHEQVGPIITAIRAITAAMYRYGRVDVVGFVRNPKGHMIEELLERRTAETLPPTPSIRPFLDDPEAFRVV